MKSCQSSLGWARSVVIGREANVKSFARARAWDSGEASAKGAADPARATETNQSRTTTRRSATKLIWNSQERLDLRCAACESMIDAVCVSVMCARSGLREFNTACARAHKKREKVRSEECRLRYGCPQADSGCLREVLRNDVGGRREKDARVAATASVCQPRKRQPTQLFGQPSRAGHTTQNDVIAVVLFHSY